MEHRRWRRALRLLVPLAVGFFAGRILSEWWLPGLVGAVAITGVALVASVAVMRDVPFRQSWPALALLAYVFYPEPDHAIAGLILLLSAVALAHGRLQSASIQVAPLIAAAAVFAAALGIYWSTLAPGLLPADSGEFQLMAAELGVPHPPGFALYTVIAHLFTLLPVPASAAYKVNLFSAVTSSLTLAVVYLAGRLVGRCNAAGLLAAVALATATTFWAQATTANIRSLTGLFTALLLLCLLLMRQHIQTADVGKQLSPVLPGLVAAFALCLALGIAHHASLVFMGIVFILYAWRLLPARWRNPRLWWRPLAFALLGLLPLLYFPLRASADVPGASPALATLDGFLEHVLALGFRGDLFAFSSLAEIWARFGVLANVMSIQFHPLLLLGIGLGALRLGRTDRSLLFLLLGAFTLHSLVTASYRAPQTIEYMLPAYIVAALLLAAAVVPRQSAGSGTPTIFGVKGAVHTLLLALLVSAALAQAARNYGSFAALHQDETARDVAASFLAEAPAESVILSDWHWVTPLWYMQQVEGQRPDLEIRFVFPTDEQYAETWARRIGENLEAGKAVLSTHFDAAAFASLPPPQPLGDGILFTKTSLRRLPSAFAEFETSFGDRVEVLGYRLGTEALHLGDTALLTIAWAPLTETWEPLTLFVHIVDVQGQILAQHDVALQPQSEGLTLTQFRLTPVTGSFPGTYRAIIGVYSGDGRLLMTPDGEETVDLTPVEVRAAATAPFTEHETVRPLVSGDATLIGYDWDHSIPGRTRLYLHWRLQEGFVTEAFDTAAEGLTLPAWHGPWGVVKEGVSLNPNGERRYVPLGQGIVWRGTKELPTTGEAGEVLPLPQFFVASKPVLRDLVVSVRLIGYESDRFHWAWWDLDDGIPALGAIPSLKWIAGTRVRDPRQPTVSGEEPLGGLVRLYDAFMQYPLPILDNDIASNQPGIPLGATAGLVP